MDRPPVGPLVRKERSRNGPPRGRSLGMTPQPAAPEDGRRRNAASPDLPDEAAVVTRPSFRRRGARRPRRLPIEPVTHLDQESIRRPRIEELAQVLLEVPVPLDPARAAPPLVPDEEEGAPGPVLPPEDGVG